MKMERLWLYGTWWLFLLFSFSAAKLFLINYYTDAAFAIPNLAFQDWLELSRLRDRALQCNVISVMMFYSWVMSASWNDIVWKKRIKDILEWTSINISTP